MTPLSENVKNRIAHLRESRGAHAEAVRKLAEADGGRIFGVDLIAWAALNRSLSLLDGFATLIETGNILCAGALLRLQVDSSMRLYACWLVDNPHTLIEPLLRGEPLKSMKSRTGERLTDAYLKTELSKISPWVESVYRATSGFVHLSTVHMISTVRSLETTTGEAQFGLGSGAREVKEEELLEALDAFIEATKCLLQLVASWLVTKEKAAVERAPDHP
jgi:hypothetical protein